MSKLLNALAHAVTKRRAVVILGLLLLLAFLVFNIRHISADFTPSDLFSSFEDQDRIVAEFQESFGTTENVVLVLVRAENVLNLEVLQYLHEVSLSVRESEYIGRAESITITAIPRRGASEGSGLPFFGNLGLDSQVLVDPVVEGSRVTAEERDELAAALDDLPLIEGRLVSETRGVAVVACFIDQGMTRMQEFRLAVAELRRSAGLSIGIEELVDRARARAQGMRPARVPPDGVDVFLAGLPYMRTVVVERFRTDQTVIVPLALLACMLILMVTVRWLPGVLLPVLAVAVSATMVVGAMGLFREPINIINNIVPALVIIIGISNAIHVISRFREELRHGADRTVATQHTVRAMAVACFLTSFTTAVGFGSLLVSRTSLLQRFGVTAAGGVLLSYIVTITLIPVLLTVVKRPARDRPGASYGALEVAVANITRWVMENARGVLVGAAIVFAVTTYAAIEKSVIDNSVLDQFADDDELVRTTRLIERELDGVMPVELALTSDRAGRFDELEVVNAVNALKERLNALDPVLSATSYTTYLHETRVLLGQDSTSRTRPFDDEIQLEALLGMLRRAPGSPVSSYLTEDSKRARIGLRIADVGAKATIALGETARTIAAETLTGMDDIDVVVTGDAYVNACGLDAVIDDLVGSLLLAVVIIFGFLTILFRDLRLGLLSIPPNVLPLVATMAYMAVRGIQLNTATAMIFAISIGMAVDATIHVLMRFREEERMAKSVDDALIRAARGTGRAIVLTCVMLMAGFSVMLISKFIPVRRFGELIAVTAFGCLLGNLILLPALLKVGWTKLKKSDQTAA